ncbi:MAG: hypothetical protein V9G29_02905 [Burkholderiaceae bacterium]
MARQRELGTNEVLGGLTIPKTIMVPRHLENTAITLLATERVLGSGNNDINPLVVDGGSQEQRMAAARRMLVVNDFLDVANDWFAFADPQRFPLFGLGFRWGDSPEIFSVADPTSAASCSPRTCCRSRSAGTTASAPSTTAACTTTRCRPRARVSCYVSCFVTRTT